MQQPLVGIIANPVSARDIRRIVAHAGNMQVAERANIVLRLLAGLNAAGIPRVLCMPEHSGMRQHVLRSLRRARNLGERQFPSFDYLEMPVSSTVEDSIQAALLMQEAGAEAIIVLGGDGTHRAVVSACREIPIAGVSTGTNNAFPEYREPTIVGLGVGLSITGGIPPAIAYRDNKLLEVEVGGRRVIALVDVTVVAERYVGARALWRVENFKELYVAFAEADVIGMSAVAGLLDPVDRLTPEGRCVVFSDEDQSGQRLRVAIAPGLIEDIGIASCHALLADTPIPLQVAEGTIALDGERELSFSGDPRPTVTLRTQAFRSIDIASCMGFAARCGLLEQHSSSQ